MKLLWVLLIVLFAQGVSPLCNAQVDELQAKSLADAAARKQLNLSESKLLRVHRREDLEDDLFYHQRKIRGKIAKAAYFYEITENGEFVISPDEAITVTTQDGVRKWLVAISVKDGQSYALYGFKDKEAAFDNLARDSSLNVDSEIDARLYSYFYFKVVKDLFDKRLVFSSRQLRHEVEDYYSYHYPEAKAEGLYKSWWKNYSSKKQAVNFGANAQKVSDKFAVTMTSLDGLNKNPQLNLWELRITLEGNVQDVNMKPIYPKP